MVIQIVYVNGATVRTGVEIEGSLVVRMLQYGDVVESFQRLKTKEGASFKINVPSSFYLHLPSLSLSMSASLSFFLSYHISLNPFFYFLFSLNFFLILFLFPYFLFSLLLI